MVAGNDSYILFKVEDLYCTLNSLDVQEILRNSNNMTPIKQAPAYIDGVINLRGEIVTVFNLANLFGFKKKNEGVQDLTVIIVNYEGEHFGFLISEVIDIVTATNSHIEHSSVLPKGIDQEFVDHVVSVNKELFSLLQLSSIVETELV